MKKNIILCSILLLSGFTIAQQKDVRTNPEEYYLKIEEVLDSFQLLPPPPAVDSLLFLNDKAQYEKAKLIRNTARGKQAYHDAHMLPDAIAQTFSNAFGFEISSQKTPEIYKLLGNFQQDAGELATRGAKQGYMRIRPFAYFNEPTCREDERHDLATNGSYPSGHTAIAWATALVLTEINPEKQNEIMTRGYEMGESRVICGYHWQSDIDAARIVASIVIARLHAHSPFIAQLEKAKNEFKTLQKNQE